MGLLRLGTRRAMTTWLEAKLKPAVTGGDDCSKSDGEEARNGPGEPVDASYKKRHWRQFPAYRQGGIWLQAQMQSQLERLIMMVRTSSFYLVHKAPFSTAPRWDGRDVSRTPERGLIPMASAGSSRPEKYRLWMRDGREGEDK